MDSEMALPILPVKNNKLRDLKVEYLTIPPLIEENNPNERALLQELVHWWERETEFDLGSLLALLFPKQSGGVLSAQSLGTGKPYITYQPRLLWLREEVEAFERIFILLFSLGRGWIMSSKCEVKAYLERWNEEKGWVESNTWKIQ